MHANSRFYLLWAATVVMAGALGAVATALLLRAPAVCVLPPATTVRAPAPPVPAPAATCTTIALRATVSRAAAMKWAASPDRLARIVPAISDGRPLGLKLYGIRPGSPLALVGIQNGDTIVRIAGRSVTEPDTALDIIERLGVEPSDRLTLDLVRRGCPVTLAIAWL